MSLALPAVTGWSTFWQYGGIGGASEPYAMRFARSYNERLVSFALSRGGFLAQRRALKALTGAAAGGAALETRAQIQAPADADSLGGLRVVETVNLINRNTAAADETYLEAQMIDLLYGAQPATYPVDLGGNGGGGKRGV